MTDRLRIPGPRDVRATRDGPDEADAIVVACPPHPQLGGSRTDGRLTAVSDALTERGIACLRFDYGPWDEGRGEVTDAESALQWARERADSVGLFGYSFGAGVSLLAAAEADPDAVSILSPPAQIDDRDVATAVRSVECSLQVLFGERDDTVDWEPVVEAAREQEAIVEGIEADHHFVGQRARVAERVSASFAARL